MMKTSLHLNGNEYSINLEKGIEISIPFHGGIDQVNCFYAPIFSVDAVRMKSFIGSVAEGGPVNFTNVKINVHGNGTHTECFGHISKEFNSVNKLFSKYFFTNTLISIYPTKLENGDMCIEKETLHAFLDDYKTEALTIRCLPNTEHKKNRKYSGTNPCYISPDAMKYIVELGVKHLLVDFPSVDREEDGGKLESHKIFWSSDRWKDCTITELIFVPDEISDGENILHLQLADLVLDAVPSRPIIYEIIK
ncbi:MAG: cyclase family protein [Saprospiraceae bacterium]